MRRKVAVFLSFALYVGMPSALGQGNASIVGTVTDASGHVVVSATVTATETGTSIQRTVATNVRGAYVIIELRPTHYDLKVDAPGFKTVARSNVTLLADQSITVDFALPVGAQHETVTVNSAASQVDTYTPTISQVVDQQRILDLPLNGRNPATLTTLVSGSVIDSGSGNDAFGPTKTFPTAITLSINGSRQNQVTYLLDGANNVDTYTNVNLPFPFPDAVQEFSVQTANYSAEYGENAGGVVDVISKSGTNVLHGGLFEFNRNAVFNARNYFANARDPLKRNQFGGTLGGPLSIPGLYSGLNRTFFFFGVQNTIIRDTLNATQAYVPTSADLNGDFSSLLSAANPDNPVGKSVQLRNPKNGQLFTNNQIDVSLFDPASVTLVSKYIPRGTGKGLVFYPKPEQQNLREFVGRLDQTISQANHLSFRVYTNNYSAPAIYAGGNLLTDTAGNNILAQSYLANDTHIFNANWVNTAYLSYTRANSSRGPASSVPNYAALGVNIYKPGNPVFIGSVSVSSYFKVGTYPDAYFLRDRYQLADDVNRSAGKHDLSFGGDITKGRLDVVGLDTQGSAAFSFSGDSSGNSLADFLLGAVRSFSYDTPGLPFNDHNMFYGLYAQDVYRPTGRLALTFGLHWSPWFPWNEIHGEVTQFNPAAYNVGVRSIVFPLAPPGLFFPGDPGFPSHGVSPSWNQFAPRVGFAYALGSGGKSSVRGGFGEFFDTETSANSNLGFGYFPFSQTQSLTNPPGPFSNPLAGSPSPFQPVGTNNASLVFPPGLVAVTYDPSGRFKVPATYDWNISLQRQFPDEWLLQLAYVGTRAYHLVETIDLNPTVYSASNSARPRLFPGYSDIYEDGQDVGSSYHSAQVTLEKRSTVGSTFLINYTYSKSLDDVPFGGGVTGVPNGNSSPIPWYLPNRQGFDYGPSEFDRTHILSISYVTPLPSFASRPRLLRTAFGDWELTGIVSLQTGDPITVLAGIDASGTALGVDRGQRLTGDPRAAGSCSQTAPCVQWLNAAAFGLPAPGTYGDVGKGSLRGPSYADWDVGLFKNFVIKDRAMLQFRAEYFNILNHTNLLNPDYSISGSGFGNIVSSSDPRIGQLALKVTF